MNIFARIEFSRFACVILAFTTVNGFSQDSEPKVQHVAEQKSQSVSQSRVTLLVAQLGSNRFATSENAIEELFAMGPEIVPMLSEALSRTSDPEIKARVNELIRQLNFGEGESRIQAFLAGKEIEIPGWEIVRIIFGDNASARELFIDMHRKHPEMMEALTNPRELAPAMEKVAARTSEPGARLEATLGDAVAMLLPATDPKVPVGKNYEKSMLFIIRRAPVNRVRLHKVLGQPFKQLLAAWIPRSTIENREEVINFCLEWGIPNVYSLALQTINESKDPITICIALQAVARYGNSFDVEMILPLLDNQSVAENGRPNFETRVCDVAAAALAKLNKVPLTKLGFSENGAHEVYGIVYDDIGFPIDSQDQRDAAIKMARDIEQRRIDSLNPNLRVPNPGDNEF